MEGTKYNLSITTSGENGDHASTNISTSNPSQLADILQLAGMHDGHPIAIDAPQALAPEELAPEEHGSCDVCGGMHEGDDHVVEGDSWDNEPDEVIHSPEEVTQTGNDLHKVKKTYPKVNGGDNPMALEDTENKLRQQFADFLAEDYTDEKILAETELVSPWAKQENDIEVIEEVEEVIQEQVEKSTENKNMSKSDIRQLMDNLDSINGAGSTVVTEATTAELQAQIAALTAQLAAQQGEEKVDPWSAEGQAAMAQRQRARTDANAAGGGREGSSDETHGSYTDADYDDQGNFIGTPLQVFGKADTGSGPEDADNPTHGSYTDADYDDQGNFIGTPLQVFGKAEVNTGGPEGASGEQYGSLNQGTSAQQSIRGRAEGLQARLAAAREAGYNSLKDARAGGHPSGSEHTWTGSGAFALPSKIPGADQVRRDGGSGDQPDPGRQETLGGAEYSGGDPDLAAPEYTLDPDRGGDPELLDILGNAGLKPKGGSWSAEQQAAMAKRQRERTDAQAAGGSDETYGSAKFDKDGKIIGGPFKGPFTKAPKQTGKENNQSGGSAEFDKQGKIIGKPFKGPFTKAKVPTSGGRDE